MNRGEIAEATIVQWAETLQQHVKGKVAPDWLCFEVWNLNDAVQAQTVTDKKNQPTESQSTVEEGEEEV